MHIHKFEKICISVGIATLIFFLVVLGYGGFHLGVHPQSHAETIDPGNVQAHEAFQKENLGLTQVSEDQYIVNVVASSFNYDLGVDEEGKPIRHIRIPKRATVLYQVATIDVIHGFHIVGTNVNMMVEPGYISKLETTMNQAGEFTLLCNEYCGVGHHMMFLTVEVYEE
ncbi:cytochrome B5 [Alkalihalobacterium alkalinitrilicum]|uniref:cytochrome B5 n=1 Tax=Alkalihalobacterium alkalinitrilicum TaxID=427920 RepID=UPI000994DCC3|nr:cytochrome B5 [Alkalihalobacterium alkalinitrilicum]